MKKRDIHEKIILPFCSHPRVNSISLIMLLDKLFIFDLFSR
ncbi:hypothetical protein SRCM101294_01109 [Bacillus amyloliquefaciens]|nr:hypothetical protein SRCM101294_01109 [Bacillus amyloliquefaciens]